MSNKALIQFVKADMKLDITKLSNEELESLLELSTLIAQDVKLEIYKRKLKN